jgi:hypothetical protein
MEGLSLFPEPHTTYLITYLLIGLFFIIAWPLCLAAVNSDSIRLQNFLIGFLILPFFYFLPIPLTLISWFIFPTFDYCAYYYLGLSILLFFIFRPIIISYLRKK